MNLVIPGKSSSNPRGIKRQEPTAHTSRVSRTHRRRSGAVLALSVLVATAVSLAACSSSGSSSSSPSGGATTDGSQAPSASTSSAPAGSGDALALRNTSLGTILTDGRGFTVYDFEADQGTTSACFDACAEAWPPVPAPGGALQVGAGVKKSLVGQTDRADGTQQLTYDGRPLYYYAGDSAPGSTTGQGSQSFGAPWYVLRASGQEVKTSG
jgi:predicted lipoprotein with Yx(FWY)xxD motif